jgi:hypothetical protein
MFNLTRLWDRHYQQGVSGSYHGDMARTFSLILDDTECDIGCRQAVWRAIQVHLSIERSTSFKGRRWFYERFEASPRYIGHDLPP